MAEISSWVDQIAFSFNSALTNRIIRPRTAFLFHSALVSSDQIVEIVAIEYGSLTLN